VLSNATNVVVTVSIHGKDMCSCDHVNMCIAHTCRCYRLAACGGAS
jgi:hypothetical protein